MRKPIHYLKARNSNFLAGVDLEVFDTEGNSNTLTIKDVRYEKNIDVNGRKKPEAIVMYFEEEYAKPLIVNTTNSKIIKNQTGIIDATKWIGFSIEFFFDLSVKMRISKTETIKGGIRIKKVNTNGLAPALKDVKTRIEQSTNKAELMNIWQELTEKDQILYKDQITAKSLTL